MTVDFVIVYRRFRIGSSGMKARMEDEQDISRVVCRHRSSFKNTVLYSTVISRTEGRIACM